MGRKKINKNYFEEEQEKAVELYLFAKSDEEKNKIFKQYLEKPLNKMVESIIRRYKLYPKNKEFDEIKYDTISFLITKIDRYDLNSDYKAYSYFGTICKNYLIGIIQKDEKDIKRKVSYEDISSDIEDNADFSYEIDKEEIDYMEVIKKLVTSIENIMNVKNLNENEIKLGLTLIDIFNNYDNLISTGEGDKFNKSLLLYYIREMTGLSTKDIRNSLKVYRNIYKVTLNSFL